jgi:diadenosine tetraphosphate (Ap4A) HIT family hydrolase
MQLAQRLGQCLVHLYQPPKVGLFVIGFHVPHVHVHVMPLYAMTDMTAEAFERAQRTSLAVASLVDSAAQIRHTLAGMAEDDTPA